MLPPRRFYTTKTLCGRLVVSSIVRLRAPRADVAGLWLANHSSAPIRSGPASIPDRHPPDDHRRPRRGLRNRADAASQLDHRNGVDDGHAVNHPSEYGIAAQIAGIVGRPVELQVVVEIDEELRTRRVGKTGPGHGNCSPNIACRRCGFERDRVVDVAPVSPRVVSPGLYDEAGHNAMKDDSAIEALAHIAQKILYGLGRALRIHFHYKIAQ